VFVPAGQGQSVQPGGKSVAQPAHAA
jgi:hypothetical protein